MQPLLQQEQEQQQQQQVILTTNSLQQHPAPWVVQPPRPTTVPNYQHRQSTVLGVILIVVGSLSIIFNIVDLAVMSDIKYVTASLAVVGHGFWSGLMCVVAGGFGVNAGRRNNSSCSIRAFMVLCILAACVCVGQFSTAVTGAVLVGSHSDICNYYWYQPTTKVCQEIRTVIAMESLLSIMAFTGGVAAIWGSALGCRAVRCCNGCCNCCCCRCCADPYTQQFAIVQSNGTQVVVPVVTQQQSGNTVLYPAQYAMQYPNINPSPYPVGSFQFPAVQAPYYPPSSTALVSPQQLPPQPEVVVVPAEASGSLSPSTQPDYKN